ncbi:MAG: DUF45 domain-containing protein [Dehalococcoidia bacterium]|nr:DUF45 domain-containing protein [Dehalococcoidia bacterium]
MSLQLAFEGILPLPPKDATGRPEKPAGTGVIDWRGWTRRPPDAATQQALLDALRLAAAPVLKRLGVSREFQIRAGRANTARFGSCRQNRDGSPPVVTVRCVRTEGGWRAPGAIAATLLHEAAHVKYMSHGPRFWGLLRKLLAAAERHGIYLPSEDDPSEPRRGDSKLAGTPAAVMSDATSERRRQRYQTNRAAMDAWEAGQPVTVAKGPAAGTRFIIVKKMRSRVLVDGPDGRRFVIAAAFLIPAAGGEAGQATKGPVLPTGPSVAKQ